MSTTARILIVDDDSEIREVVGNYLTKSGYRVSTAKDGETLRSALGHDSFELVLLDLHMPGEDGFSLMPYIKSVSQAGIIVLTGSSDSIDEVVGLELGADDYVSKPCDLRHLVAHIRAVLRRTATGRAAPEPEGDVIRFDGWTLDLGARRLLSPEMREVALTTAEFNCLNVLASHAGRVLSRERLLDLVYGREWNPLDRAIDTLVSRLRKKLEQASRPTDLIKNVRGIGYVFTARTGH